MAMIPFFAFFLLLQGALGELICEEIPMEMCSLSVSFAGKRCLLETGDRTGQLQCRTSEVLVNSIREHIETDECVDACGADRNDIGISSDALLESQFIAKLCSTQCLDNCPNIVDLYSNLALAEGEFLPILCMAQKTSSRRAMSQLKSSGTASAPVSALSAPSFGSSSAHVHGFGRKLYAKDTADAPAPL